MMAIKAKPGARRGKSVKPGFNIETLEKLANDLKSGSIPLDKMALTDDVQVGLRAIVRDTGAISFHVQYQIAGHDRRPYLKIGDWPGVTLDKARKRAKAITSLGSRGIDVMEGLHERLMKEIDESGEKWKP